MPQMFLSLKTLAEFDNGLASELWQGALEAAVRDCKGRVGLPNARVVTLKTTVKPVVNEHGTADEVEIRFDVDSKIPLSHTTSRLMAVTAKDQLYFQSMDPLNPYQLTMDESGRDD